MGLELNCTIFEICYWPLYAFPNQNCLNCSKNEQCSKAESHAPYSIRSATQRGGEISAGGCLKTSDAETTAGRLSADCILYANIGIRTHRLGIPSANRLDHVGQKFIDLLRRAADEF